MRPNVAGFQCESHKQRRFLGSHGFVVVLARKNTQIHIIAFESETYPADAHLGLTRISDAHVQTEVRVADSVSKYDTGKGLDLE